MLKDQAAEAVEREQRINNDLKKKLASAELNVEKERKKNDDLEHNLEDAAAEVAVAKSKLTTALSKIEKYEKSELEAAVEREVAVAAAARAAAAATRAASTIADEQEKNNHLEKDFEKAAFDAFTAGVNIQKLETEAAETAETLKEATRIVKIYKNSWSYHFFPPSK